VRSYKSLSHAKLEYFVAFSCRKYVFCSTKKIFTQFCFNYNSFRYLRWRKRNFQNSNNFNEFAGYILLCRRINWSDEMICSSRRPRRRFFLPFHLRRLLPSRTKRGSIRSFVLLTIHSRSVIARPDNALKRGCRRQ
jgi:hypothetical protein